MSDHAMSEKRVRDAMATELHTVDGLATVTEALAVMRRHDVSSLVVTKRHADDEVGVLEVARIAAEIIARNRAPARVHAYEVMRKPVVTIAATMLSRYAVRLMVDLGLSRAVVVNAEGDPIGVVTLRDLVLAEVVDDEYAGGIGDGD